MLCSFYSACACHSFLLAHLHIASLLLVCCTPSYDCRFIITNLVLSTAFNIEVIKKARDKRLRESQEECEQAGSTETAQALKQHRDADPEYGLQKVSLHVMLSFAATTACRHSGPGCCLHVARCAAVHTRVDRNTAASVSLVHVLTHLCC